MYNILTLNKISKTGLDRLDSELFTCGDAVENPDAILVRSASMHEYELSENTVAIARAGAGVNNIPIPACSDKGVVVFNTPGANANAVAELVICSLFLASRKVAAAIDWCKTLKGEGENVGKLVEKGKGNFAGPEILGKTLGIIGMGAIGAKVAESAIGLGMDVIAYDPFAKDADVMNVEFVELDELFRNSDIISLHCPLTEETDHIIDEESISKCKKGVVIINTSRGALVDAEALLNAIKSRKVGAACLDVYEEESDLFFEDYSGHIIEDDTLARLISMPNVIVTSHQAFLTEEALSNIAETTVNNITEFFKTGQCPNELCYRGGTTTDCKSGKCF